MAYDIILTEFACKGHFECYGIPGISDVSTEEFIRKVNEDEVVTEARVGYAPFCKLVFVKNWTNARVGTMLITSDNKRYLKSEYVARTDEELPVLIRWLELPLNQIPRAEYLCLVLYSKAQLIKENIYVPNYAKYGIVAILGQKNNKEEPMTPITIMRNALGIKEGGSGYPIDRIAYIKSIEFWNQNAIVKEELNIKQ